MGAKSQNPKSLSILHMLILGELKKKKKKNRQTEGITIESFDASKKEWIQLPEVHFEVTKSIMNLQRKLFMSWVLMLNVKRERRFKCISFMASCICV